MKGRYMVIIPARLSSTRFAQKVLYPIMGIPMVVLVARQALQVDDVVVAADDERIVQACQTYNIRAILTQKTHPSGTDRLAEATEILGLSDDSIVVNVQGDEPFIEPEIIHGVRKAQRRSQGKWAMYSLSYELLQGLKNDY